MSLLEKEVKTCHKCGARGDLKTFTFGLATVRLTTLQERDSVGCLLVSLSFLMPGSGLARASDRTNLVVEPGEILVLQLRVCRRCGPSFWRPIPFETHPLWEEAHARGFTKFVSEKELDRLVAQRGPQTLADPIDSETHDH
jgi:ribosomal protein L40E